MKVVTDIRKSTPVLAVVGVTDLAGAEAIRAELSPAKLQADAANLPSLAITTSLAAAGKAEETYGELAARGKSLVTKVRRRSATKDLLAQGKSTLTLSKAAVTTVRKAGDETLVAAKATLTAGRREAAGLVGAVVREAETEVVAAKPAAKQATANTRAASKRTVTTARTRTATAKKATKATTTSARKTATKAAKATTSAAQATGTPRPTAARKTAARKAASTPRPTAARKTAARKTAARKTAARKAASTSR